MRLEHLQRVLQRGEACEGLAAALAGRDRLGHALQRGDGLGLCVKRGQVRFEEAVEEAEAVRVLGSERLERETALELASERAEEPLVVVVVEQLEPLVREHHDLLGHGAVGALDQPAAEPGDAGLLLLRQLLLLL